MNVSSQEKMPVVVCKLINFPSPVNISWPIVYAIKKSYELRLKQNSAAIIQLKENSAAIPNEHSEKI